MLSLLISKILLELSLPPPICLSFLCSSRFSSTTVRIEFMLNIFYMWIRFNGLLAYLYFAPTRWLSVTVARSGLSLFQMNTLTWSTAVCTRCFFAACQMMVSSIHKMFKRFSRFTQILVFHYSKPRNHNIVRINFPEKTKCTNLCLQNYARDRDLWIYYY